MGHAVRARVMLSGAQVMLFARFDLGVRYLEYQKRYS